MSDRAELLALILKQQAALGIAGKLLGRIGTSRSVFADEAWAAFSHCFDAVSAVAAVEGLIPSPTPSDKEQTE